MAELKSIEIKKQIKKLQKELKEQLKKEWLELYNWVNDTCKENQLTHNQFLKQSKIPDSTMNLQWLSGKGKYVVPKGKSGPVLIRQLHKVKQSDISFIPTETKRKVWQELSKWAIETRKKFSLTWNTFFKQCGFDSFEYFYIQCLNGHFIPSIKPNTNGFRFKEQLMIAKQTIEFKEEIDVDLNNRLMTFFFDNHKELTKLGIYSMGIQQDKSFVITVYLCVDGQDAFNQMILHKDWIKWDLPTKFKKLTVIHRNIPIPILI